MNRLLLFILLSLAVLSSCSNGKKTKASSEPKEDKMAKQMLQGIWVNSDDESVTFMAKGDSIFYADTTSQPVAFKIIHDTIVLSGDDMVKYKIVKQAPHLFEFKNQGGDIVKLVKSSNPDDKYMFEGRRPQALNQSRLIKRDTVIVYGKGHYHLYVQVNPTTYKVIKSSYNDDGVEVGNVYYDNIVHLSVFNGASQLFSHDFRKSDFKSKVPDDFLTSAILSDLLYTYTNTSGFHFNAQLCQPDSPSSYIIDVCISFDGRLSITVK